SKLCSFHDVEVVRKPRGVINCPLGHKLHGDVNSDLNTMKKAIKKTVNVLKKPFSFLAT
ncbi:transposase, partial [Sulfolobus sp. F1]